MSKIPPIFFRPPPHVSFEQGYCGVTPDHGPEASMQGNVEVRLKRGKAVRLLVELRLVESWGKDQKQRRASRVNDRQYELWKSLSEGREHVSNMDMPFSIKVPPYLPSSLALDPKTGVGITYTLVATLFLRVKGTFGRWNEEVIREGQVVNVERYDTLPAWPVYQKPLFRDQLLRDVAVRLQLSQTSIGLQDRLAVDVIIENKKKTAPLRIRKINVRIHEVTIVRIQTRKGVSKRVAAREISLVKQPIKKIYVHANETIGPANESELRVRAPFPIGYDRVSARGSVVEVAHTYSVKVKIDGYDDILFKNLPFLLTGWTVAESHDIAAQIGPCDAMRQTEPLFDRSETSSLPKMPEYKPTIVPQLTEDVHSEDPYDIGSRSDDYATDEPDPRYFKEMGEWDSLRDDGESSYPSSQYDDGYDHSYSTASLPDLHSLDLSRNGDPRRARTPQHVRTLSALTPNGYSIHPAASTREAAQRHTPRFPSSSSGHGHDGFAVESHSSHSHVDLERDVSRPSSYTTSDMTPSASQSTLDSARQTETPGSALTPAQRKAMMARYLEAKAAIQKSGC